MKNLHKLVPYVSNIEHASTTVIGASFIAEHVTSLVVLALFLVLLVLLTLVKEGA